MSLEEKRKELQLKKIDTAIAELEYKIEERLEDIKRIEDHILLQKEQEEKTKLELKELKGE